MTELSERARRVLELARHEDDPDVGAAARVERSLAKRVVLGAAIATGTAAVSKSAAGAGLLVTASKSALVAGVATALAVTGLETFYPKPSASEARPPAAISAPNPRRPRGDSLQAALPLASRSTSVAPDSSVAPGPTVASPTPGVRPPVRPNAPSPAASMSPAIAPTSPATLAPAAPDRLAIEAQELRGAQRALRAGDNERALALLEQQDARHSLGALAQERQAARVLALCQSQQLALARREAESFETRFPESPLLGKVRGACRGR